MRRLWAPLCLIFAMATAWLLGREVGRNSWRRLPPDDDGDDYGDPWWPDDPPPGGLAMPTWSDEEEHALSTGDVSFLDDRMAPNV